MDSFNLLIIVCFWVFCFGFVLYSLDIYWYNMYYFDNIIILNFNGRDIY